MSASLTFPFGHVRTMRGVVLCAVMDPTRVLVVDDHADASELLCLHLERLGYTARDAQDGKTALVIAEELKPHVAVVDLWLPDMMGHDIARELRSRDPKMLLIALTGSTRREDHTPALMSGFDAFLMKPADHRILLDLISRGRSRYEAS
jgi:two-component system CheB/CheR fusion protein